jgi:hypothetical protein
VFAAVLDHAVGAQHEPITGSERNRRRWRPRASVRT